MKINIFILKMVGIFCMCFLTGCAKDVDENPVVDPHRLAGEYRNSTMTIIINGDKTYNEKVGSQTNKGVWSIQDSYLTLTSGDSVIAKIKVIEAEGVYQLLLLEKDHQDPDTWDWSKIMEPTK